MARIRTIKPEFWRHEDLSELSEATHMLAAALLNYADDEGYFNANPGLIKGECSPLREPSVSIQDSLAHLSRVGFVRLGRGEDGKRYGQVITFLEHQRINRPTPSKISGVGIVWDDSPPPHPQITEPSPPERNREGKGTGKGKEQGEARTRRAASKRVNSLDELIVDDELQALAAELAVDPDAELPRFRDWCGAKGKTFKDYRAAFRNWLRNAKRFKDQDDDRKTPGRGSARDPEAAKHQRRKNIFTAMRGELDAGDRGGGGGLGPVSGIEREAGLEHVPDRAGASGGEKAIAGNRGDAETGDGRGVRGGDGPAVGVHRSIPPAGRGTGEGDDDLPPGAGGTSGRLAGAGNRADGEAPQVPRHPEAGGDNGVRERGDGAAQAAATAGARGGEIAYGAADPNNPAFDIPAGYGRRG